MFLLRNPSAPLLMASRKSSSMSWTVSIPFEPRRASPSCTAFFSVPPDFFLQPQHPGHRNDEEETVMETKDQLCAKALGLGDSVW